MIPAPDTTTVVDLIVRPTIAQRPDSAGWRLIAEQARTLPPGKALSLGMLGPRHKRTAMTRSVAVALLQAHGHRGYSGRDVTEHLGLRLCSRDGELLLGPLEG